MFNLCQPDHQEGNSESPVQDGKLSSVKAAAALRSETPATERHREMEGGAVCAAPQKNHKDTLYFVTPAAPVPPPHARFFYHYQHHQHHQPVTTTIPTAPSTTPSPSPPPLSPPPPSQPPSTTPPRSVFSPPDAPRQALRFHLLIF